MIEYLAKAYRWFFPKPVYIGKDPEYCETNNWCDLCRHAEATKTNVYLCHAPKRAKCPNRIKANEGIEVIVSAKKN